MAPPTLLNFDDLHRWLDFKWERTKKEVLAIADQYKIFPIPKKKGRRIISAPLKELKDIQKQILGGILEHVKPSDDAHGFIPERSILTNAWQHKGAKILLNIDLKNFFSNIPFARVKSIFSEMGYIDEMADILATLCTIDAGQGYRHLPTGAPTSPQISNILCRRMDERFYNLIFTKAEYHTYTRYADDLTFSSSDLNTNPMKSIGHIRFIIASEGFDINEQKVKVLQHHNRQVVTGLVVNDGGNPRLPRKWVRRLRAILHNCEEHGIESQSHGDPNLFVAQIEGKVGLAMMVDEKRYKRFKQYWQFIKANDRLFPMEVPLW